MRGDPTAQVHADGTDFSAADPNAGEALTAGGLDVGFGEGIDDHLFECADVGNDVALPIAEVEDGVDDELAGAVVGDIAAAVGVDELDARLREELFGGEEVFAMTVAAHGDDVRVFEEEKLVRDEAGFALGHEFLLQGEGLAKGDAAQVAYLAIRH